MLARPEQSSKPKQMFPKHEAIKAERDVPNFTEREKLSLPTNLQTNYPYHAIHDEFQMFLDSLELSPEQIAAIELRRTPAKAKGDYGFACFKLAQSMNVNPNQLAQEYAAQLNRTIAAEGVIQSWEAVGAYVNAELNMSKYTDIILSQVIGLKEFYGAQNLGQGKIVIIDLSSPNIAKPMSIGHLRSAILGYVFVRGYEVLGYEVVADNHLGDWGTNFGHLMHAIKSWGNMEQIKENPIPELVKLYVQVTAAGDKDEAVKDKGREWFLKLEQGDLEALDLWRLIRQWSLDEFKKVYQTLDIQFDEMMGESYFQDDLLPAIDYLQQLGLLELSEDALVIDFSKYEETAHLDVSEFAETSDLLEDPSSETPIAVTETGESNKKSSKVILIKKDGASVYLTRDVAALLYRVVNQLADKIIYVVGDEQRSYFEGLFAIAQLMKLPVAKDLVHAYFGLYILPEGKMSTRKGRVILLEDLINQAFAEAEQIVRQKKSQVNITAKSELTSEEQTLVAQLAIGALRGTDFSRARETTIVLDRDQQTDEISLDKAINFKGDSAFLVQYTYARTQSVLDRFAEDNRISREQTLELSSVSNSNLLTHPLEKQLVLLIGEFPEKIQRMVADHQPVILYKMLIELTRTFNTNYSDSSLSIINATNQDTKLARLKLTTAVAQTIKNGLWILGIEAPARM